MATKFDSNLAIDWYRSPVDPDVLESLNARSDLKGLAQAGGYLAVIVLTGSVAVYVQQQLSWLLLIPALLLHGTVCAFMTNAEHELVHGTVFERRWLNTLFLRTFGFLRWFPHDYYWASHTEHHKYTLHPPEDLEVVLPTRFTLSEFLRTGFVDPVRLVETLRNNFRYSRGRFEDDWENYVLVQDRERRAVSLWARTLLAGHLAIVAVSICTGYWIVAVVVSLTPFYGGWLFFLCNSTQHAGLRDKVSDFRLCCRTMYLSPIVEFLYWHMNYHTEHHMYAAVPCYNLPRLHELVKSDLPPTLRLVPTWRQMIETQRRQQLQPDYQYDAPLPRRSSEPARTAAAAGPVPRVAAPSARPESEEADRERRNRLWECSICGFVYSERDGLPEAGIPPGTAWDDVPDDWTCPDCGTAKAAFNMVEVSAMA